MSKAFELKVQIPTGDCQFPEFTGKIAVDDEGFLRGFATDNDGSKSLLYGTLRCNNLICVNVKDIDTKTRLLWFNFDDVTKSGDCYLSNTHKVTATVTLQPISCTEIPEIEKFFVENMQMASTELLMLLRQIR